MFALLLSCETNEDDVVPSVPVDLTLSVYSDLSGLGVGTTLTITPDSTQTNYSWIEYDNKNVSRRHIAQSTYGNGIILYRADLNYYIAYDKTCPYNARVDYCPLTAIGRGIMPICKCCGSVFMLNLDGAPSKDSKTGNYLRMYRTNLVDNQTQLIISN